MNTPYTCIEIRRLPDSRLQETFYTMPKMVYDVVARMAATWPAIQGARPRFTMERAMEIMRAADPDLVALIQVKPGEPYDPKVKVIKADQIKYAELHYDDPSPESPPPS